jgi:DNA-binding Lrp family transcriptional regulator
MFLDDLNQELLVQLSEGLPICSHPYAELGKRLNITENDVIDRITTLHHLGIIKRFGVVVKHAALGYRANAMCVWQIPENQIDDIAQHLLKFSFVSLCYQRPMQPKWRYNLYCMIHGKDRKTVINQIAQLNSYPQMKHFEHQVLFSLRCFKQRGAVYRQTSAI